MMDDKITYDSVKKVWSGVESPRIYGTEYSVGRAALEAMLESPNHIGQICYHNDKEYTNKELAAMSISVAHHFTKLGLEQCEIIGICASNSDFVAPLFFGAMLKGLIVSTLDVSYDKDGIKHTFGMTKPKLLFCDGDIFDRVNKALQELGLNIGIYTMNKHKEGQKTINEFMSYTVETLDYNFEPLKMGHTQTAAVLCSSGTTGLPKGVTMSHEDLINKAFFKLSPVNRFLCFSTLHWFSGLITLLICTFFSITRVISDKSFSAEDLIDMVEKYRVTLLFTPPSQMALTLAALHTRTADLSSIKRYTCGGSAVSYAVAKQLKEYMPNTKFYIAYGLSETRCSVASGELQENVGLIGKVSRNVKVKILDNEGQKLGPNEVGEIHVKTPYKWRGYYGNEKATADAFDDEGWIITGDLGFIDDEGRLYIVDRKKDILKYNNFHYFPTEIEQVIRELNDVVDVCVCGLPDLVSTDLPAAAVVKKIGCNLTEQDVYDHVAQHMAHFKQLRGGVYFFDKLPLTATGKVLRSEVKKNCEKLRNGEKLNKI